MFDCSYNRDFDINVIRNMLNWQAQAMTQFQKFGGYYDLFYDNQV